MLRVAGGIVHINVLGNHIIILNRLEDAKELFEKRSQIYSDRPHIPMVDLYVFTFFRVSELENTNFK